MWKSLSFHCLSGPTAGGWHRLTQEQRYCSTACSVHGCSGQGLNPIPVAMHYNQANHSTEIFFLIVEERNKQAKESINRKEMITKSPHSYRLAINSEFSFFLSPKPFVHGFHMLLTVSISTCNQRSCEAESYSNNNNLALSHISDWTSLWLKKTLYCVQFWVPQ